MSRYREDEDGQQTQQRAENGTPVSHLSALGQNEANPTGNQEQTTPLTEIQDGEHTEGGQNVGGELEATSDVNDGRTKRLNSKASTTKAGRPTSAASSRQPVQKVVYYQNRFITVNIDPVTGKVVETGGPALNAVGGGGSGSVTGRRKQSSDAPDGLDRSLQQKRGTTSTGAGGAGDGKGNMSAIEIDTIQHDPSPGGSGGVVAGRPPGGTGGSTTTAGKTGRFGHFKVPSCLKTCHMYVEDNRMKTGSAETKEKLKDNNKMQDTTNLCLKKVLNIIFITTGVSLFLAVVIVIIYTSIGEFTFIYMFLWVFITRKISIFLYQI